MLSRKDVAATIDHAVLKPNFTVADTIAACQLGKKYGVATVCVRPCDVAAAKKELAGSPVKVSMVVGFPHGANRPEVKALETRLGIQDGAEEVDMVMNIGRLLACDDEYVRKDIAAVVAEAKPRGVLVKVILETCWLKPEQIARACQLAEQAGAQFVKTSTGFGDGPATPEAVAVMLKTVAPRLGVKASGGVRTWDTAVAYLNQGCTRLGVASTAAVLDGGPASGQY